MNYGKLKEVYFLENYSHIMCRKIRVHLYKIQFEKLGVINPKQAAEDYTHFEGVYDIR